MHGAELAGGGSRQIVMQVRVDGTLLELAEGDIAEQETDAVVTAAHWDLGAGQGTDGSIHFKAGPELLAHCRTIGGCPIGGAVITPGFRLKAPYVIHAVGPVYDAGDEYEEELLAGAYQNSLRVAVENGLRSISFPSISTGAFNYPMTLAAPVALRAILDFLRDEPHDLDLVRMVLYPREVGKAYSIYAAALRNVLNFDSSDLLI
jgi:O-acetyl-ADP-ribose deacetylase